MSNLKYIGTELDLFAEAHNWKSYWAGRLRPFITGDVLEVGAGIGANSPLLDPGGKERWVCLEPDLQLITQLQERLGQSDRTSSRYEAICGSLQELDGGELFDTIIYVDVLEHIQKDRAELEAAATHLRAGGAIIVLSPAIQYLYSPFDAAIGHFRRYDRSMLRDISPASLRLEQLYYLDSAGLLLSAGNRLLLRQSMPTKRQIYFWDTFVVPVSRILDKCLLGLVGKSIVAIWRSEKG